MYINDCYSVSGVSAVDDWQCEVTHKLQCCVDRGVPGVPPRPCTFYPMVLLHSAAQRCPIRPDLDSVVGITPLYVGSTLYELGSDPSPLIGLVAMRCPRTVIVGHISEKPRRAVAFTGLSTGGHYFRVINAAPLRALHSRVAWVPAGAWVAENSEGGAAMAAVGNARHLRLGSERASGRGGGRPRPHPSKSTSLSGSSSASVDGRLTPEEPLWCRDGAPTRAMTVEARRSPFFPIEKTNPWCFPNQPP